jgi:hypothetical protein
MAYNTYQNPNRNFGRSLAFSEFLNQLTPEQKRKIVAAEALYLHKVSHPSSRQVADAAAFADSFKGSAPQTLDPASAV